MGRTGDLPFSNETAVQYLETAISRWEELSKDHEQQEVISLNHRISWCHCHILVRQMLDEVFPLYDCLTKEGLPVYLLSRCNDWVTSQRGITRSTD